MIFDPKDCTPECYNMPKCRVCKKKKRPQGKSVPLDMTNAYCGYDCKGYVMDPKPGHYWLSEMTGMQLDDLP